MQSLDAHDLSPKMLRVHKIRKIFTSEYGRDDLEVLRDISFEVAMGEFVSIIGPSGCGKTTLLRIIHGLEPATEGNISVLDQCTDGHSPLSAIVFQQFNLFPWLTVSKNVAFGLEVAKVSLAECAERTNQYIRVVGLEKFSGHYPHELSGGMQQRVGLARALALDPQILLMDEPFGALDAITREQLQHEIADLLVRSPKTVVYITHNMDEAIFFSDRILVMSARPARILEEVRVELPRPRKVDEVLASRQFTAMRKRLWSLLSQTVAVP
jgi:ABC-type nitrate/sulfonate/bicarbonate transport system ATPase subunit